MLEAVVVPVNVQIDAICLEQRREEMYFLLVSVGIVWKNCSNMRDWMLWMMVRLTRLTTVVTLRMGRRSSTSSLVSPWILTLLMAWWPTTNFHFAGDSFNAESKSCDPKPPG